MSNVVPFRKAQPKRNLQNEAIVACVEYIRQSLYTLPSTESRVHTILILISHLAGWLKKSNYYEKPSEVIHTWVDKQLKKESNQ